MSVKVRLEPSVKRSTVLVALVASLTLLVAALPAVGAAQSVDPIVGWWQSVDGTEVIITAQGGSFVGVIKKLGSDQFHCYAEGQRFWQISKSDRYGSDSYYEGTYHARSRRGDR